MTHLDCRRAMHDAERHARNMEEGNEFALAVAVRSLVAAEVAYMSSSCEPRIAQRLHVAMDRMGEFV